MRLQVFQAIQARLSNQMAIRHVAEQFPGVSYDTLLSIYSISYQQMVIKTSHTHRDAMPRYYQEYKAARTASGDAVGQAILLQLAERVNMPPCILARHILRFHFNEHHPDWTEAAVKAEINKIMKEPDALPDVVLRQEIVDCIVGDLQYSPDMILAKQLIGHEYELRLRLHLSNCGIPFMAEADMRRLGYPKTPDFRLLVPCSVNGRVVQWIESKASFGDPLNHDIQAKEQYFTYYNRYGPGLVIYWFGFVDELASPNDPFLLLDHFPLDIQPLRPDEPVPLLTEEQLKTLPPAATAATTAAAPGATTAL